ALIIRLRRRHHRGMPIASSPAAHPRAGAEVDLAQRGPAPVEPTRRRPTAGRRCAAAERHYRAAAPPTTPAETQTGPYLSTARDKGRFQGRTTTREPTGPPPKLGGQAGEGPHDGAADDEQGQHTRPDQSTQRGWARP